MANQSNDMHLTSYTDSTTAAKIEEMEKDLHVMKRDMADVKKTFFSLQNSKEANDIKLRTIEHRITSMEQESLNKERMVENTQRGRTKALLDSYIDNLTIHGATKVFKGSVPERILWAIVTLSVLGFLFFSAKTLLTNFLSNGVINDIKDVNVEKMQLPSVTVCDFEGYTCHIQEYENVTYRKYCKNLTRAVSLVNAQCQVYSSDWLNCSHNFMRKSEDNLVCLTINQNQTIMQKEDGSERNFRVKLKTFSKRVRLFFHQQDELPAPYLDRIKHIAELGKYNVILMQKNIAHLAEPYPSKCIEEVVKKGPFSYTKTLCKMQCYAEDLKKKCGSLNAYWLQVLPSLMLNTNQTESKNKTAMETSECFKKFIGQPKPPCQCRIPCHETRYSARIERIRDNREEAITLQIYFETREITMVTEVPSYDTTRFLADIGGLIGLLLGMSVLSVFEVLFCLVLFIVDWILSRKHNAF